MLSATNGPAIVKVILKFCTCGEVAYVDVPKITVISLSGI